MNPHPYIEFRPDKKKGRMKIKTETAMLIIFIAMLVCFAGFIWALFEGKLIDKLL